MSNKKDKNVKGGFLTIKEGETHDEAQISTENKNKSPLKKLVKPKLKIKSEEEKIEEFAIVLVNFLI